MSFFFKGCAAFYLGILSYSMKYFSELDQTLQFQLEWPLLKISFESEKISSAKKYFSSRSNWKLGKKFLRLSSGNNNILGVFEIPWPSVKEWNFGFDFSFSWNDEVRNLHATFILISPEIRIFRPSYVQHK